jgi:kumamolisin
MNAAGTELTGSPACLGALLGTTFVGFAGDGASFYGHTTPVTIPRALRGVTYILGLDNLPIARTLYVLPAVNVRNALDVPTGATDRAVALTSFTPLQVARLYGYPAGSGSGQRIAIIELGGGYRPAELATYFAGLGIAAPAVTAHSADGIGRNNPADTSGANVEVLLDIEVAGALAPGAAIAVYFAANSFAGFYAAIAAAIASRPCAVSISWGAPERYWPAGAMAAYNALFAAAVAARVNVFCASGDNGSSDGAPGLNVDFPASSPNVVACGGTTLSATADRIVSETTWNAAGSATGGGYSATFPKPAYQTRRLPAGKRWRGVPDVAANANPHTGYQVYVDGRRLVVGGTSAVAPLLAGLCARVCQVRGGAKTPFWNAALYSGAVACTDVRAGNNGAYAAAPGWDPCTGMGRINGPATARL